MKLILSILISIFFLSFSQPPLPIDRLKLPPGFKIEVIARVGGARQISISPRGIIFVGSRGGVVNALLPIGPGRYETVVIARGLNTPNGVHFHNGILYVGLVDRILRYPDIENRIRNPPEPTIVATFPTDRSHGWKYIKVHNNRLYVPVGAPCNTCNVSDAHAALFSVNLNGTDRRVIARGIRNTVGFDWDPETGNLWFTENGRDNWGNDTPPDELNHVPVEGRHYGFPYCYGKNLVDSQFNREGNCNAYVPATYELGPHVAALGLSFYTGTRFPQQYRNNIIFAEHGSWNRQIPIGYRVMWVNKNDRTPQSYKVFIDGWLNLPNSVKLTDVSEEKDTPYAWGRPVDVLNAPDGSIFISDDKAGAIYRVFYE